MATDRGGGRGGRTPKASRTRRPSGWSATTRDAARARSARQT